jgi:hypothetical protein
MKHPAVRKLQAALYRAEKDLTEMRNKHREIFLELRGLKKLAPRPARFKLDAAMSEEEIERTLRGAYGSPIVKAIVAHVGAKIVTISDLATDVPREMIVSSDRVIPPYTGEMRLHDSGRASGHAELLSDIQRLTEEAEVAEERKPAA